MVWRKIFFTAILTLSVILHLTSAQLSTNETLHHMTACDLNIKLNCGQDSKIAINSLQYAYNVSCDATCCTYDKSHCFVKAEKNDIQDVTRDCSGKSSCNVNKTTGRTDFSTCSIGVQDISYVYLEYYCIPSARIMSVCSNGQLEASDGKPLYLTSQNYPAVTTGSTSCSCSFEVFSCTSNINMYTIDADLYLDTSNCEQNLNFLDTDNNTLSTIDCDELYNNNIESKLLNSHYVKIDFINNSTSNQQGLFFVGLDASGTGERYQLTCSSQPETWCAGCGILLSIDNGNITLSNENDFSYEATAEVTCDSGYKTDTPNISCQANGSWPIAKCTEKPPCSANEWRCDNGDCILESQKCDNFPNCTDESDEQISTCQDRTCPEGLEACYHSNGSHVCVDKGTECGCGTVPSIENGIVSLDGNSSFGSVADVTCNEGYAPSSANITCLMTGSWENVSCTVKDCGPLPELSFGQYILVNGTSTVFGSVANVICDPGYTSDKLVITCQSSAKWETALCSINGCGSVPSIENGIVSLDETSIIGSVANVTCNIGYYPSSPTITCLMTGSWETVSCVAKGCGPVPSIENGIVSLDETSIIGSVANVTCNKGYDPSSPTITCLMTGSWETVFCAAKALHPTEKKDTEVDIIIIIVVLVLCFIILLQLLVMCYLQCKIHNIRRRANREESEVSKRILMTILGSIPVVGLIPIYITWKMLKITVYKLTQMKEKSLEDSKGASNPTYGNNNMPINKNAGEFSRIHDASEIELEQTSEQKTVQNNMDAAK
ncbi:sushi, von Willebrand factor type A, EGF and pentraxin domain-containing protein 1-like isoform X2 [Ruditapes philippinarum]|uniref:sushi, von Willebrand factor type A, EGF and pentraxin domain-containing protein 1-like isoform X2 n=1 Tax=Ruditapes philippinarum TaxID=129788 RepID=UPI00295BB7D0|nr:sushi, von Willebrand factor type A, EGF and pentraxin domain-containing protein 1-like isoform X2 [Ruditapes philippinarum]